MPASPIKERVAYQEVATSHSYWTTYAKRDGFVIVELVQRWGAEWWLRTRISDSGKPSRIADYRPLKETEAILLLYKDKPPLTWAAGLNGLTRPFDDPTEPSAWMLQIVGEAFEGLMRKRATTHRDSKRWRRCRDLLAFQATVLKDNQHHNLEQTMTRYGQAEFEASHVGMDD